MRGNETAARHRSVDQGTHRPGIELRNDRNRSADALSASRKATRTEAIPASLRPTSARSEILCLHGNSRRENRETRSALVVSTTAAGRSEEAMRRTPGVDVDGESDGRVVLTKYPNPRRRTADRGYGGKAAGQGEHRASDRARRQSWVNASSGLLGVREVATSRKRYDSRRCSIT
jgi:hypothetical protein